MVLIDSNVLIDLFTDNPSWADWSQTTLEKYSSVHRMLINPIIYSEISIGFERIEELEDVLREIEIEISEIPKEALFLAGKAFLKYKKSGGSKSLPLPDFFIGAHAGVLDIPLMTRDARRFKSYFPTVKIISPNER